MVDDASDTPQSDENENKPAPAEAPAPTPAPALKLERPDRMRRSLIADHGSVSATPASIRHIDWRDALPFTHLFRGFAIARHPVKLFLALAAVLLIYAGGRTLDGIWSVLPGDHDAVVGEARLYGQAKLDPDFSFKREKRALDNRYEESLRLQRERLAGPLDKPAAEVSAGDMRDDIVQRRDEAESAAKEAYDRKREAANSLEGDERDVAIEVAREQRDATVAAAYADATRRWTDIERARGQGLFQEFYDYELLGIDKVIAGVLSLSFAGVFDGLYHTIWVGPSWALSQHPIYFTLLFAWSLMVMAVFGGAISRIAAVGVARDEPLQFRSALRFATQKFVSFVSAPLIPLGIAGVLVLVIAGIAALGAIPYFGEVLLAVGMPLALIGGVLVAVVLIGLVGGFSLMYPTIAAAGTDSFDAISVSYNYLSHSPWRLAFYGLVSLVYGVIAFLVVRLFIWLVLIVTHTAMGLLLFREVGGVNLLEAMWPQPASFADLSYDIDFINLSWLQGITAIAIGAFVYLLIGVLAAFGMSLYFTLSTITYFLMRRVVDLEEMDVVYMDPADEEYDGYADLPSDPDVRPDTGDLSDDARPAEA